MHSTLSGVPARLTGRFQTSALRGAVAPMLISAGLLTASCSPSRIDGEEGSAAKVSKEPGKSGPTPPIDPVPAPCKKVDVLFVIDNSGSMADNQQSLIASFPGFVDGMKKYLASAEDVHIGVVTSDSYYQNDPACTAIGSLVTKTGGPKSSGKRCDPYDSGSRFLTTRDPLLKERFACAAQVGAGGSDDERMARALLDAVAPKAAVPGKCNAGFLRPDSLLVVVMITDEDDVPDGCDGDGKCASYGSGGTPDDWYAEFLRYRPKPENVVVLSLLGRRADNPCGAVPASRLMRFTNKFGSNAFLGDICASTYDQFFVDALPVISSACSIFLPPPG